MLVVGEDGGRLLGRGVDESIQPNARPGRALDVALDDDDMALPHLRRFRRGERVRSLGLEALRGREHEHADHEVSPVEQTRHARSPVTT
jgi:hypothetical protein